MISAVPEETAVEQVPEGSYGQFYKNSSVLNHSSFMEWVADLHGHQEVALDT